MINTFSNLKQIIFLKEKFKRVLNVQNILNSFTFLTSLVKQTQEQTMKNLHKLKRLNTYRLQEKIRSK